MTQLELIALYDQDQRKEVEYLEMRHIDTSYIGKRLIKWCLSRCRERLSHDWYVHRVKGLHHFLQATEIKVCLARTQNSLAEYHEAITSLCSIIPNTAIDLESKKYTQAIHQYAESLDCVCE